MAKTAEVATTLSTLTPFQLKIEADSLREELVLLSGDLKKYGYDFTKTLDPLRIDPGFSSIFTGFFSKSTGFFSKLHFIPDVSPEIPDFFSEIRSSVLDCSRLFRGPYASTGPKNYDYRRLEA